MLYRIITTTTPQKNSIIFEPAAPENKNTNNVLKAAEDVGADLKA